MNEKTETNGLNLKVLLVEDSIQDSELIQEQLKSAGYQLDAILVENEDEYISALQTHHFDIILSDFNLPGFDAFEALKISQKLCPTVPFICVSGSIGEETAIEFLKLGAVDYVLKDRPNRLPFTVKRALEEKKEKKALQLAEEELKRNEAKFRTLTENIPDIIARFDRDLRHIYINPAIEKVTGMKQESFIGKTNEDLGMPAGQVAFWNEKMREAFQNKEQMYFEFDFQTAEGTSSFLSLLVPELSESGEIDTLLCVTRDITEKKRIEVELRKSEERLRDIIFSTADWVWEVNKDGKYTYSSQKAHELFDEAEEDILGKTPFDFMPEEEAKRVALIFSEIVSKREAIKDLENWNIGKNGELICLQTSGLPFYNDKGEFLGYRGIDKNITAQKHAESELIQAKEKAEESDRLKSAFLANMSHEIRTPMNGILGFASLLKEPELSGEQQQEYIQIIEKSGARMLSIINDIISISKIESGIQDIRLSETNINSQLQFIYDSFKLDADRKGLSLSFSCGLPDKLALIKTDYEKFYGILTNLIRNAIKYTDEGSVAFGYKQAGEFFEFYIKDSGIGIPKDRQEVIFERFIQADISNKMAKHGAGLGLSIAKAYTEMLGGQIWVESEDGIGSSFYFTLPRDYELRNKIQNKPEYPAKPVTEPSHSSISGLKVLLAEDDEVSEMLMTISLEKICRDLLKAGNGQEAIEICRNHPDIDVILMDIQMPGISGYDATREIRKFNKDVIIIAQTAFAVAGDKEKALAAGCNSHLPKPIRQDELLRLLEEYFGKG